MELINNIKNNKILIQKVIIFNKKNLQMNNYKIKNINNFYNTNNNNKNKKNMKDF